MVEDETELQMRALGAVDLHDSPETVKECTKGVLPMLGLAGRRSHCLTHWPNRVCSATRRRSPKDGRVEDGYHKSVWSTAFLPSYFSRTPLTPLIVLDGEFDRVESLQWQTQSA